VACSKARDASSLARMTRLTSLRFSAILVVSGQALNQPLKVLMGLRTCRKTRRRRCRLNQNRLCREDSLDALRHDGSFVRDRTYAVVGCVRMAVVSKEADLPSKSPQPFL
jgi:hypothetical protein